MIRILPLSNSRYWSGWGESQYASLTPISDIDQSRPFSYCWYHESAGNVRELGPCSCAWPRHGSMRTGCAFLRTDFWPQIESKTRRIMCHLPWDQHQKSAGGPASIADFRRTASEISRGLNSRLLEQALKRDKIIKEISLRDFLVQFALVNQTAAHREGTIDL